MWTNMKSLLLRGPFLTLSGYGTHSRQIARWAYSKTNLNVCVGPLPWGNTPWAIDPNMEEGLIGRLMAGATPQNNQTDITLQLQLPNEWDPKLGRFNVGLTAGVETDRCHPGWIEACNRMNKIIVPSQFVKNTLETTGKLTVPIHVVHESYNDAIDDEEKIKKGLETLPTFSTNFNLLIFGQLTGNNPHNDRKNLFNTVKWLCDTFSDDSDVGIVLKINGGRDTKIDRDMMKNLLSKLTSEVRKGPFPRIHLLHGRLSDAENAALFKHPQIKALVSLTRGEGFGLPILDAAASGLPVITTQWSGHLDFMNLGKYIPVSYTLREVHDSRIDNAIFIKGAKWAEPNEEDFKRRVKKFRQSPDMPIQWATELSKTIKQKFSINAIMDQYDAVLGDIIK